jgi:Arc/MetJ family transcription regulator
VRTNIVLDEELVAEAMRGTGIRAKRAAVDEALRMPIQLKRPGEILALRAKLNGEATLDPTRRA